MYVGFEFQVLWYDNDVMKLGVSAWNGAFGGRAEIYEVIGDLQDVAAQVRGFPKDSADVREIAFGNFDRKLAAV